MAKRKSVKIEAVKAWGRVFYFSKIGVNGKLESADTIQHRAEYCDRSMYSVCRVRIIREADYRRLLKAAKPPKPQ